MSEFSKEYGKALFSLAKDEQKEEIILKEILEIDSLIKENKDYITLIDTPAIPFSKKEELIDEAFSGCSLYVKNFIKILCEKKSFYCFSKCVKEYLKAYDEENNIERVEAVTSVPLTEDQLLRLKEKTEKITGKTIVIENQVDKSIIGGVILKLKNTRYDGSVKKRLDEILNIIRR